jgi:hypothetical protein
MPTAAVRELRQIPIGLLLGSTLKSVVEAQALAAQTTVDFIQEVGFKPSSTAGDFDPFFDSSDPDLGELRTVTFKYDKTNEAGDPVSATLSVPFLSILPIPLLRVDETTFELNAKLTDVHQYSRKSTLSRSLETEGSGGVNFGFFRMRMSMRGSISSESESRRASRYSREYKLRVYVKAVQDDIPAGMAKVFQILEDSIREEIDSSAPTPS